MAGFVEMVSISYATLMVGNCLLAHCRIQNAAPKEPDAPAVTTAHNRNSLFVQCPVEAPGFKRYIHEAACRKRPLHQVQQVRQHHIHVAVLLVTLGIGLRLGANRVELAPSSSEADLRLAHSPLYERCLDKLSASV